MLLAVFPQHTYWPYYRFCSCRVVRRESVLYVGETEELDGVDGGRDGGG